MFLFRKCTTSFREFCWWSSKNRLLLSYLLCLFGGRVGVNQCEIDFIISALCKYQKILKEPLQIQYCFTPLLGLHWKWNVIKCNAMILKIILLKRKEVRLQKWNEDCVMVLMRYTIITGNFMTGCVFKYWQVDPKKIGIKLEKDQSFAEAWDLAVARGDRE